MRRRVGGIRVPYRRPRRYSPPLRDDLIPRVYHRAKAAGMPMTHWVNRAIEAALATEEEKKEGGS